MKIKGTNLAGATKVTFNGTIATVVSDKASKIKAYVPAGATTGYIKVTTPGGTARSASKFTVLPPFEGAVSVVSEGQGGNCALLASSGVDCWGNGMDGALGDGKFYNGSHGGSAIPAAVLGVGGTGTLTGVTSLVSDGFGYCALLTSSGVNCWGNGYYGELGNGEFYTGGAPNHGSATPVVVEAVGGTGSLSGVTSLVGGEYYGYCALLISSEVDCWGYGENGNLGNGTFSNSATPVAVEDVGGTGTLTGVTNLFGENSSYCALLTSGGLDCWGNGFYGELGNGAFYTTGNEGSATPVEVEGVGGTGTLTGVTSLVSDVFGYCALLTSGGVDCWGAGNDGQLGNGTFYTSSPYGSATPVAVEGVGGTGTLTGVASLFGENDGYCALLTSDAVDCWGNGMDGALGDGNSSDSATPVAVEGIGGTGSLSGVTSLLSENDGYCALLTSDAVDCWGYGIYGELGDGTFSESATPVAFEGVGGTGSLAGVTSLLVSDGDGFACALLTSGGVDCWGNGYYGELGNGAFYTTGNQGSATPVQVG